MFLLSVIQLRREHKYLSLQKHVVKFKQTKLWNLLGNGFLCKFKQCSKHDLKSIDCDPMLLSDDLIMQSLSVTIKYQFLAVVSKQI